MAVGTGQDRFTSYPQGKNLLKTKLNVPPPPFKAQWDITLHHSINHIVAEYL